MTIRHFSNLIRNFSNESGNFSNLTRNLIYLTHKLLRPKSGPENGTTLSQHVKLAYLTEMKSLYICV